MIREIDRFVNELHLLQRPLLLLDRKKARMGFKKLFIKSRDLFERLFELYKSNKRGDTGYFIKKQTEMILRYLGELEDINQRLADMDERQVITFFEKQYKLKKIVLKLREHI